MSDPDASFTLAFVGYAGAEAAERASAYEDRVLPLLADHGARLLYRGTRVDGEDTSLPLEVHVTWFPHRRALDAYMADERRSALMDEFGDVFTAKHVVEVVTVTGPRPMPSADSSPGGSYPGRMDETELLSGIVTKTGNVIAGVRPDQLDDPTPCPDMNVGGMVDHLVGWIRMFAAAANGLAYEGDPTAVDTADPVADFRSSAESLVAGWREHGFDRTVALTGGDGQPAEMVFNITVMEYLTHGWDLAVATGQPVPYSEEEATEVLRRAEGTLRPEYRGETTAFGEIVPVPDDAPVIDRLVGFMGRRPQSA